MTNKCPYYNEDCPKCNKKHMTNKELLKEKYDSIFNSLGYDHIYGNGRERLFAFFWNEIEQIRKEDMERVVEVLKKEIDSLYIFGHSQAVGGLYTDEKMRGSNVENASWIKKEDVLEVLSIIKQSHE